MCVEAVFACFNVLSVNLSKFMGIVSLALSVCWTKATNDVSKTTSSGGIRRVGSGGGGTIGFYLFVYLWFI
jgi:hypothetical protein